MILDEESDTAVREREITAASFDDANEAALSAALGDIGFVTTTLKFAAVYSKPPDFEPWFHAVALFNRARETLVSSVHLARHRVPVDAFALLRVAVETAAVAVHVTRDPVAFEMYRGLSPKKYDSKRAITPVGALIPRLPEVWGVLSRLAIHTNVHAFGPNRDADGSRVVHLFSWSGEPLQDRQSLRCVSLAATLVFRAVELVLLDESSDVSGWLKLPGSSSHATATAARLVEKRYQEFISGEQKA